VLYDVTEERQRGQQLGVLNRVLRHNLRSETMVVNGYAELLKATASDSTRATQAGMIAAASGRLNSTAEKAREFEDVQERGVRPESLSMESVVGDVAETRSAAHVEATVAWTVEPAERRVHADRRILSVLLDSLIENGIVHSDAPEPTVSVTVSEATAGNDGTRIEIRDGNDRMPEHEVETL